MSVSSGMNTDSSDKAVAAHLRHLQLRGRADLTVYHRAHALRHLAGALPVPLLEATPDLLYQWRDGLRLPAAASVATTCSHVKSFYDWCAEHDLIAASPAAHIPVPPVPRREPRPISEKNLQAALDHASPRIRIWLVLAAWCGLRAKEIALLRAGAIQAGGEQPCLHVLSDATKGRKERTVPLPPFAVAELAKADLQPSGMAFRRADGKPLRPWLVSKLCNEHLHALGIADTFHSLRHRYLTQAYHLSKDIQMVARLAGHAHIQTTAGYAAADMSAAVPTVNAIPAPGQEAS